MHSPGLVGDPTLGFVHARQAPLPKEQEPQAQHTCLSVKGALHHFFWGVGGISCTPCRPHPPASGSTLQYHLGLQSARARTQGCFHPGPVLSPTERPLQPSSSFFLSSSLGAHTQSHWLHHTCVGFRNANTVGTALCFRFLRFPKALKHSGLKCSEQMTVCCLGLKLARPMLSTHSFSSSGRLNGNLQAQHSMAQLCKLSNPLR